MSNKRLLRSCITEKKLPGTPVPDALNNQGIAFAGFMVKTQMPQQQYKNHVRYYTAHHFIFYPLVLGILIVCLKYYTISVSNKAEWLVMAALTMLLGGLSFMMRQHYALTNQNRTVRLEMRLRYYQLTQKRFEPLEQQLSFKQIAALRFAGDNELVGLIVKTLAENLPPDAIKRLVTDWQPDTMRV